MHSHEGDRLSEDAEEAMLLDSYFASAFTTKPNSHQIAERAATGGEVQMGRCQEQVRKVSVDQNKCKSLGWMQFMPGR